MTLVSNDGIVCTKYDAMNKTWTDNLCNNILFVKLLLEDKWRKIYYKYVCIHYINLNLKSVSIRGSSIFRYYPVWILCAIEVKYSVVFGRSFQSLIFCISFVGTRVITSTSCRFAVRKVDSLPLFTCQNKCHKWLISEVDAVQN